RMAGPIYRPDARLARLPERGRLPLHDGLVARRPAGMVPYRAWPAALGTVPARLERFGRSHRASHPRQPLLRLSDRPVRRTSARIGTQTAGDADRAAHLH